MKKERIHFGTLEDILLKDSEEKKNIPAPSSRTTSFDIESIRESTSSLARRDELEREIVQQRKFHDDVFIPTDEEDVKIMLRKYGEPITYFGEKPENRYDRLRSLILSMKERGIIISEGIKEKSEEEKFVPPKGVFYTKGHKFLRSRRKYILEYSLNQCKKRLENHNTIQNKLTNESDPEVLQEYLKQEILKQRGFCQNLRKIDLISSHVGDMRPIPSISLSENKDSVVTGSWSGIVKLWNLNKDTNNFKRTKVFKAHSERVTSVKFNPKFVLGKNYPENFHFVSASVGKTVKIWNVNKKKPLSVCNIHSFHRLGKLDVHPSGLFFGSTSFDGVWHFCDIEKNVVLFEQEGHSTECYSIAFHPDGSLAATCDFGGIVRIWDLRNGGTVCSFVGHSRKIMCIDFSPNGYSLASGGDDNIVRIWNLRRRKCEYMIPAHTKLISDVKFEKIYGRYLLTSSYDRTIRIWKNVEYSLLKTLKGHGHLVMCIDVGKHTDVNICDPLIVSSSYDKCWKVWK